MTQEKIIVLNTGTYYLQDIEKRCAYPLQGSGEYSRIDGISDSYRHEEVNRVRRVNEHGI
jgi:hypothetical protein